MKILFIGCSAMALTSACLAAQAQAQMASSASETPASPADPAGASALGDIIVTAQKRSESLQQVPISVSVVTDSALKASGALGIQSLKVAAPNVDVNNNIGFVLPFIRGVGSKASGASLESPVSIYVDGVYYASTTSTLLSFSNIDQIEVLKGPQGTLFGRNATGGVIHVKTREPSATPGGDISLSYGNYRTLRADAYVTTGVAENVAADLTLHAMTMGEGYGRNLRDGAEVGKVLHDLGVRTKWRFDIGDTTVVHISGDYTHHSGSDNVQRYPANAPFPAGFGPSYGGRPWDTDVNVLPHVVTEGYGGSLKLDQEIGTLSLTSITAYRRAEFASTIDIDYSQANVRHGTIGQRDRQFSQEIQLQSPSSGRFSWTLGAFYFNARSVNAISLVFANAVAGPNGVNVGTGLGTESIAGFGQATFKVTDQLSLTGGLRYTSEKRTRDGNVVTSFVNGTVTTAPGDASTRFNKLTWRLAADYRFADRVLGYVSYNRGFKSGGYNSSALTVPAFLPEVLDAYEIGLKSDLSRQVRLNLSGFYYDYKDIQVQRYIGGVNGVYNGAKAELYGGEIELIAQVTPDWKLSADYQYLHGKFKSFPNAVVATPSPAGGYTLSQGDVSGNRTPISPRSTLSVNSTYVVPLPEGSVTLVANGYYNSGFYHEPDNELRQSDYFLLNASVRWDIGSSGLALTVWGNNLTNKAVAASGAVQSYNTFGLARFAYEPPRTYGATVSAKF